MRGAAVAAPLIDEKQRERSQLAALLKTTADRRAVLTGPERQE